MTGSSRLSEYDSSRFSERDWKHLRIVHVAALERFCSRVTRQCRDILDDANLTAHERYLRLFRLLRERDEELASAFDDMRRSRAISILATELHAARAAVLHTAYAAHPERFVHQVPIPPPLPTAAWINPRKTEEVSQ